MSLTSSAISIKKLHFYLSHKADLNKRFTIQIDNKGVEVGPIVYLASQNCKDRHLINALLKNNVSINEADSHGYTPLVYAIKRNAKRMVKFYLTSPDIDTNAVDGKGKTPIHHVVNPLEYGSYENVELLKMLAEHYDINKADSKERTPIYYAHLQESGVMVEALKKLGAKDIDMEDETLKRPATSIVSKIDWGDELILRKTHRNILRKLRLRRRRNQKIRKSNLMSMQTMPRTLKLSMMITLDHIPYT